jgi:hypothetical protein
MNNGACLTTRLPTRVALGFDFGNDPFKGSPLHPPWTCRNWMYDGFRAAKAFAQPVCLQIGPRFLVSQLAFVYEAANTCSAKVTS